MENSSWRERAKGVGRGKSRRAGRESVGGHRGEGVVVRAAGDGERVEGGEGRRKRGMQSRRRI